MTKDTVLPSTITHVPAPRSGFVQLVDVRGLHECLNGSGVVYVLRGPGKHVLEGQPLAQVSGNTNAEVCAALAEKFVIGDQRSFEQDPKFGLHVMSEIAEKSLSPGVNDAGTAIETISRLSELLWAYGKSKDICEVRFAQVFMAVPADAALVQAAFAAIGRHGAGQIEVAVKLRKALRDLAQVGDQDVADAARGLAKLTLDYAEAALPLEVEVAHLKTIFV